MKNPTQSNGWSAWCMTYKQQKKTKKIDYELPTSKNIL